MKRSILISTLFAFSSVSFAQTDCSKSNALFKSDNYGTPKEVYKLGSNPEFPFLRNLSNAQQVVTAMKRNDGKPGAAELNNILKDIGFANGIKDVTTANVTAYHIPEGTIGNMGDGNYNTAYIKLVAAEGNNLGVKSWKVTSGTGCYVYLLSKCGNAFYPTGAATACLNVPVNLKADSKEVTLESSPAVTSTNDVYIYYHKKNGRKDALAPEFAGLTDKQASNPVRLNTTKKMTSMPQSYRVSVTTPDQNVKVCEDKPVEVAANINVEKTTSFAGYYPAKGVKQYKEVSKKVYRKTAKKLRKAEKKQAKIALLTHTMVTSEVAAR